MKRIVAFLLLALSIASAVPAGAVCTSHGTATATSSQVVKANDVYPPTPEGRWFLFIQNTGTVNSMNVSIGSNNQATSSDILLAPGASFVLTAAPPGSPTVPAGDVAVISASGTTWAFCDH